MPDRSSRGRIWVDPELVDFGEHSPTDSPVVRKVLIRCADINDPKGYYAALGVSPGASAAELRQAYRRVSKDVHPDRNADDPDAEARFIEVQAAWDALRDPAQREAYDGAIDFYYEPQVGLWWICDAVEPDNPDEDRVLMELELEAFFGRGVPSGAHEEAISIEVWDEQLTLTLRMELSDPARTAGPSSARPRPAASPPPAADPAPTADPVAPTVVAGPISLDAIWRRFMDLSPRARNLLVAGSVGWVILLVALLGGCNKTVVRTVTFTETSIVTTTVAATTTTAPAGTTPATTTSVAPEPTRSVSFAVLTAHGKVDPVPEIGRVFAFTVNSPTDTTLFVKDRPAGGAPCAPTEDSDTGNEILNSDVSAGRHPVRQAFTWPSAGAYLFCMWLGSSSSDASSKVSSATIRFRQPRGSVSFSSSPSHPSINQATVLRFVGTSEVPRTLFVKSLLR